MSATFSFYEVVQIKSDRSAVKSIDGLDGAVLGRVDGEGGIWIYAIHVFERDTVWDLRETELVATGRHMTRADFYDGDVVSVVVDERTGRGRIKGA